MGFWHTGYIEFHESSGLEDFPLPTTVTYPCKHCSATFSSPEELRVHRFEQHPYQRPVMFLRGIEVGTTPLRITQPLEATDVIIWHCRDAWINASPVPPAALGTYLSGYTNDTVTVTLRNEGVEAEFRLRFEVAATQDLDGVDGCFFDVMRQGRLDGRAVEDFIQAARDYPTADGYYNGICEYFYGVLIKERSACASLPYWMYRVKFTMAVDVLRDFDRPLARAICGLVAFHFNQFPECAAWMANARAGIAARRFSLWLEGRADMAEALLVQRPTPSLEMSLTDYESERVLAWSMTDMDQLRPHLSDIEAIVRQDIPEFDRNKLRILLAEYYVRNASADDARRHARELRSSPALGTWAARLLAQLRAPHGQGTTQR